MMSVERDPTGSPRRLDVARIVAHFGRLWARPALGETVAIAYSNRLKKSWARTNLETRTIRLASDLRTDGERLEIVLCHELAHVAAYDLVGRSEGPHGVTWARLIREAGYEPVLRLLAAPDGGSRRVYSCRKVFLHRCLVCNFSRSSARQMKSWRCADCVAAGLRGDLLIVERRMSG